MYKLITLAVLISSKILASQWTRETIIYQNGGERSSFVAGLLRLRMSCQAGSGDSTTADHSAERERYCQSFVSSSDYVIILNSGF